MEFGDLFSKSWGEYKQNFGTILKIFLVLSLIPSLILIIVALNDNFSILVWIFSFIFIVLSFIMTISIIYLSIYQKKNVMNFGESVKGGLGYFWKYFLLTLLIVVCLIPLFLLLIIPGIIFAIYWVFAPYVLIKENVGPWEAMKRSKVIVNGRWWGTFGYMVLLMIVITLIQLPFRIGIIFSYMGNNIAFSLISSIIPLFAFLITTPLTIFFMKNFYLDRKGGKKAVGKKKKK